MTSRDENGIVGVGGERRALAPVLAITLLIGLVAVGSVGIFVFGMDVVETTTSSAEIDRVQGGFVQLGETVDTVALSTSRSRDVDLDLDSRGEAVRTEGTGRIAVTVSDRGNATVEEEIGAIEYERDGETIAYQGGGVWRGTGAEARMVSAPPFHYRDGTLTMHLVTMTGERSLSGDSIGVEKRRTVAPRNDVSTVEGRLVSVTVESEYYGGWAQYFRTRTSGTAVSVDHENETVTVDLGQPSVDGDFENAVVARGDVRMGDRGNGCIHGTVWATGSVSTGSCAGDGASGGDSVSISPLDHAIGVTVDAAREDGVEIDPGEIDELENGTYFVDGDLRRTDPLEIDVGEGDVTLVVDGHVQLDGASIDVVGTEEGSGVARVYATGDVAIANGGSGVTVEGDAAGRFQMYGTSEMHFALGQGSFVGTVFAPRREPAEGVNRAAADGLGSSDNCGPIDGDPPDVCLGQGNVEFVGSIVSGPMSVEQSSDLYYDEGLQDVEPSLAMDGVVLPPPLTHMHVAVHEIEIGDD